MLSDIPFFGPILFDHDPLTYLSILVRPAGLARALPHPVRAHGPRGRRAARGAARVRHVGHADPLHRHLLGGALAGLGGAQLSTAFTLNWSENMTVGRGFVAVSLVIFAAWNPMKAIVGAYLFSGAIALQLHLQANGTDISQYLLQAVPYLAVIVVLAVLSRRRAQRRPRVAQPGLLTTPTPAPPPTDPRPPNPPQPPPPTHRRTTVNELNQPPWRKQ